MLLYYLKKSKEKNKMRISRGLYRQTDGAAALDCENRKK